jgi:hypothetical protein
MATVTFLIRVIPLTLIRKQIKNVKISDKYIFALGDKTISVYNYNGNKVSDISYKGEANGILPTDDFVFIVSLDKISRCFSYGDSEIELSN